ETKNPVDACFYGVFSVFWTTSENSLADRGGFEPPIRYSRIHAFQACAFNHSATCPTTRPTKKCRPRSGFPGAGIVEPCEVIHYSTQKYFLTLAAYCA